MVLVLLLQDLLDPLKLLGRGEAADGSLIDGYVLPEPLRFGSLFELLHDVLRVLFVVYEGNEGRCPLRGCGCSRGSGGEEAAVRGGAEAVGATEEKARERRHRWFCVLKDLSLFKVAMSQRF